MNAQCLDCNHHFVLTPSGEISDALSCPDCGGLNMHRHIPTPVLGDGEIWDKNMVDPISQRDQGGNPDAEGTIVGGDTKPYGQRDDFMHSKVMNREGNSRMERTLDMEPYPALWDTREPLMGRLAGPALAIPAAEVAAPLIGDAAAVAAPAVADGAGALAGGLLNGAKSLAGGIGGLMKGIFGGGGGAARGGLAGGLATGVERGIGEHVVNDALGGGGGGAGGAGDQLPGPANQLMIGRVSDYESPGSVPSTGLTFDDPTRTDSHEFDDGDNSNNPRNPNLDDSGMSGDETGAHGFAENSPALERASLLMPLLMHYYNSPESGAKEALIMGLHKTLHDENPNYLHFAETPEGKAATEALIHHHKGIGVHAKVAGPAMPGLMNPIVQQQMQLRQQQQQQTQPPAPNAMGQEEQGLVQPIPSGGLAQGVPAVPIPNGVTPPIPGMDPWQHPQMPITGANHQGPITAQQIAAVQQLLIQQGRIGEVPQVPLAPQDYAREMDEIAQNPNSAPQVDPSQIPPPPPPPQPMMDPSQGGPPPGAGGPPPGPVASVTATKSPYCMSCGHVNAPGADQCESCGNTLADAHTAADSVAQRCPKCKSGTTGLLDATKSLAHCHACGNVWKMDELVPESINTKGSSVRTADNLVAVNPDTRPAADQDSPVDVRQKQDSSLSWQDSNGQQLQPGKTYEMQHPGYSIPDMVKIEFVHGDDIGFKPVGHFSNIPQDDEPMIRLSLQRFRMDRIQFTPTSASQENPPPASTTPGEQNIGPASQTTDQVHDSYPDHTSSSVRDDGTCPKCGHFDVTSVYSSANSEMHQCYRCAHAWETRVDDYGHEASVDLSWLTQDVGQDEFWTGMERASQMREAGVGSRSLSDIAAKDERLAQISERLKRNKMEADEFLRTSGKRHSPSEQRSLIDEQGLARNSDLLDLEGTHYVTRYDQTGKANGMNVPDSHLLMGI